MKAQCSILSGQNDTILICQQIDFYTLELTIDM